jgi:spore germination protein YaaH
VEIIGSWESPDRGQLDEYFTYSDGEKQRRVWTLTEIAPNRYKGTASDVVGEAVGEVAGNALNWSYTLALPVDGKVYNVQFNDWMYQMDDKVMLNKAKMSKFGIYLGEVTLAFYKR